MTVVDVRLLTDGYFTLDKSFLVFGKYQGTKYKAALKPLLIRTDKENILVDTGPHRRAPVSCREVEEQKPRLRGRCGSPTRKHRETEHHRNDLQHGAGTRINRPLTTDREPGLHLLTRERTTENSRVAFAH